MTAYAREFNPAARAMLERTRIGKTEKIRQQVAKLVEQEYPMSYE